ncbi:MAG: glycosyltransferase family 2 protein [Bacillota bacterium]|nr:glycosyltransferase family 2 protein [Bacillota bacterium]
MGSTEWYNILFDIGKIFFQVLLVGIFAYYLLISAFAWRRKKEASTEEFPIKNRFAMLVAAHNEEAVIPAIIKSLKALKYPKNMYDIFIIADNCTDTTANVAKEHGVKVFERFDSVKKGKGNALEWMFKKLSDMKEKYDGVCIFDADNLISPNFLLEMNKQMCLGHKVVQGYLDSKNPSDTWISGNNSIAFWISNRMLQLPRYYLGLSCILGGTGFMLATEIIEKVGWKATCLTEDLEFSLKLVLKNYKIYWAHDAVIYDEKPLTLKQSWRQRKRWMQGHFDCVGRFFVPMFKKALKEKSLTAFDCCMYLLQPITAVINGLLMVAGFVFLTVNIISGVAKTWGFANISIIVLTYLLMYLGTFFVAIEGKVKPKVLFHLFLLPFYNLTWVPIVILGFINRDKKDWVHTLHTRVIDMSDLQKLEKVG